MSNEVSSVSNRILTECLFVCFLFLISECKKRDMNACNLNLSLDKD